MDGVGGDVGVGLCGWENAGVAGIKELGEGISALAGGVGLLTIMQVAWGRSCGRGAM